MRSSFHRLALPLLLLAAGLTSSGRMARAQETPFAAFEEVTAVDLLVELSPNLKRAWRKGELGLADFDLLVAGEPGRLVGIEPPTTKPSSERPWHLVLYFDLDLLTTAEARRAVRLISPFAADLLALGEVEVVVADPMPRRTLPPTRDLDMLDQTLARLALQVEGADSLLELRSRFDEIAAETSDEEELALLANAASEGERFLVQVALDRALNWFVDHAPVGPRRAVFLATTDMDFAPRLGENRTSNHDDELRNVPSQRERIDAFARTAAAFKWTVFPLLPEPPREDRRAGLRIGKWRFYNHWLFVFGTYEEDREPKKARAFLELGDALGRGGRWEEAVAAYRKAIFHFKADLATENEEIVALGGLEQALDALDRRQEARGVARIAAELRATETATMEHLPGETSTFAPLLALAESSAGALVRDSDQLREALASLGNRIRLTYQLQHSGEASLLEVEVRAHDNESILLRAPMWTRRSIPRTVPESRARRLLAGDPIIGDLEIEAHYEPTSPDEVSLPYLHVEFFMDPEHIPPGPAQWRLTVLSQPEGDRPRLVPTVLEIQATELPDSWTARAELRADLPGEWLAVVLEETRSGIWGAALVDSGDRD